MGPGSSTIVVGRSEVQLPFFTVELWNGSTAYVTGGTNANALVGGTWPTLRPGENTISWSGGVTGVTLTPRWWTL